MSEIAKLHLTEFTSETPPMSDEEIQGNLPLVPGWQLAERQGEQRLARSFTLSDFTQALAFTNQVGQLAEAENHHPVILTEWGRVTIVWWTHKIHGLHQNDFIMAARTNDAYIQQISQTSQPKND